MLTLDRITSQQKCADRSLVQDRQNALDTKGEYGMHVQPSVDYARRHDFDQTRVPSLPRRREHCVSRPGGCSLHAAAAGYLERLAPSRALRYPDPGCADRRPRGPRRQDHGRIDAVGAKKGALEKTYKPDSVPSSFRTKTWVIISLELELPRASCGLPEGGARAKR